MAVKRWSVGVDGPDENGNLVAYADYLSLAAENSSLRLTIDNIVNALKLGDGPVSQQVIELVTGLVAEIKAQGVDDAAECFKDASVMSIERNQNMYDGLKKFSATLRAGGKVS